jgi:hypothetical protein
MEGSMDSCTDGSTEYYMKFDPDSLYDQEKLRVEILWMWTFSSLVGDLVERYCQVHYAEWFGVDGGPGE